MEENEVIENFDNEEELTTEKIEEILTSSHAYDVATNLDDIKSDDILREIFENENKEYLAEVLKQATNEQQTRIVEVLDYKQVVELFSHMSKDDIVDILGDLDIGLRKKLLNMFKRSESRELEVLLGYEPDTAGGIMTTEYIGIYGELTLDKVLAKIREIGPKTEVIESIFVLDHANKLVGVADLRQILNSPTDATLYSIMKENVIYTYPEVDQEEVARLVSNYDLHALPVVNHKQAIIGIITVDDVIDVMVEEQTEDILRLSGVNEEEKIGGSIISSIKRRLPWLLVNLATAFTAAMAIRMFEGTIAKVVALAMSMTVVSGMGGNAATQTLALVVRGITLGEIDLAKDWKIVAKEIMVGMIDGLAVGVVAGIIMYLLYGHNIYLGIVILLALIGNLMIAATAGFFIPLIISKLGRDPALVSSVFITTITDLCGFILFLGIATLFLPLITG